MKEELLGLNHLLSFFATCQTVRPRSSALSSGHLRIAPPKSSSGMPRCFRYHAASAALSPLLLENTPPIPVTFAIVRLLLCVRRHTPCYSSCRNRLLPIIPLAQVILPLLLGTRARRKTI